MITTNSNFALRGTRVSQRPLAIALALCLGSVPLGGLAATIAVKSIGDPGVGPCSLRQAIVSMNTGALSGGCLNPGGVAFGTNDTINFDIATFPYASANTISLADASSSTLAINDHVMTIDATANGHVTITRPRLGNDTTNEFRIIYDSAVSGGSLTLKHLTLSNGRGTTPNCNAKIGGGGICIPYANFSLRDSTLSGNTTTGNGGGIFSEEGTVALINSTLSGNGAAGQGGAIYVSINTLNLTNSTLSGNSGYHGGGILTVAGAVTLTSSTLSGNSAATGGGIYSLTSNVTLTNSTVSGNSANGYGGLLDNNGSLTLNNSTVSANSASIYSGIGIANPAHTLQATNSIVAGNSSGNLRGSLSATSSGNFVGGDPQLSALANNGGPTQTMQPIPGSLVIDTAIDGKCTATDQRGVVRPQGAHCDIGAVELTDRIFASNFDGTPTP